MFHLGPDLTLIWKKNNRCSHSISPRKREKMSREYTHLGTYVYHSKQPSYCLLPPLSGGEADECAFISFNRISPFCEKISDGSAWLDSFFRQISLLSQYLIEKSAKK